MSMETAPVRTRAEIPVRMTSRPTPRLWRWPMANARSPRVDRRAKARVEELPAARDVAGVGCEPGFSSDAASSTVLHRTMLQCRRIKVAPGEEFGGTPDAVFDHPELSRERAALLAKVGDADIGPPDPRGRS